MGSAQNPYTTAYGPYPIRIRAPHISSGNPIVVKFFNDDDVAHEIHASSPPSPHDPNPIPPHAADPFVRNVPAAGTYDSTFTIKEARRHQAASSSSERLRGSGGRCATHHPSTPKAHVALGDAHDPNLFPRAVRVRARPRAVLDHHEKHPARRSAHRARRVSAPATVDRVVPAC